MGNNQSQFSSRTTAAEVLAAYPDAVRNKNIIITGYCNVLVQVLEELTIISANTGIGKDGALQFAKHGANVILGKHVYK